MAVATDGYHMDDTMDDTMDLNGSSNNDHMDMMMMMYFHLGTKETILFKGWKTHNWQTMLGSCVAVFIMAALYEGLKVGRELLLKWFVRKAAAEQRDSTQPIAVPASDDPSEPTVPRLQPSVKSRMCSAGHLIQTVLHIVQIVVSYFLMLIFMTYNFYLCLAVALGAGLGHFLFSWKRTEVVDINEHCH